MADDTNQTQTSTSQAVDPISAFRETYGNANDYSDSQIYHHLSNPAKFRETLGAHPQLGEQFKSMSDDEIGKWSARKALTRPDIAAPPAMSKPKPPAMEESALGNLAPQSTGEGNWKSGHGATTSWDEQNPGVADGQNLREGLGEWAKAGPGGINRGVGHMMQGDVAKGMHEAAEGVFHTTVPALPLAGPELATQAGIRGILGGTAAGAIAKKGAEKVNLTPDQQDVAGDVGGALGGAFTSGSFFGGSSKPKSYDAPTAAAELTKAVNPKPQYRQLGADDPIDLFTHTKYQQQLERQLPKIQQFAKDNQIEVNSQESLAKAAYGTHRAQGLHFQENILGPNKNISINSRELPLYQGPTGGAGETTLGQLYKRLGDLNAELDPKYTKGGGGTQAAQAAVRSTGEIQAEANQIRQRLYGELSKRTGLTPEQVAEANQSIGELKDVAEKTRGELGKERQAEAKTKKTPWTITPTGTAAKQFILNRGVAMLQGNPSDRAIARVFKGLNIPAYSHAPIVPPTGAASPFAAPLSQLPVSSPPPPAAALGSLPVPSPAHALQTVNAAPVDPAAALGRVGAPPDVQAPGLYRGAQQVPAPISEALASVDPFEPKSESLRNVPKGPGFRRGDELGELARQSTAGEKQAEARFMKENPSALGRIPPTDHAKAEAEIAKPTPTPSKSKPGALAGPIGKAVESKKKAEWAKPDRDTKIFGQVRREHPDWSLSDVAQEAAKRVKGDK